MKKIYLSLLTIAFSYVLNAQCTALLLYPTGAVTPTAAWTDVDACNYAGEYALVNVIAGNIYEFSTCAANGSTITFDTELTLRTNTGALIAYSDDYCGTQSYVSWTATYTGQVQIHLHEYTCLSNSICSNIRMKVTSSVPAPIPANNDCVNATNLPVNASCVLTSGTTIGATEDLIPDPSCDPGSINDVWYTFNSGPNTSINITVNLVTASWIGIEIFTACGTLAPGLSLGGNAGNCDFNTSAPNPTVASGLTPNTVYRFRLFTNVDWDIAGSFTVCLTIPPPPPPPTVSINSASICPGASTTLTATPSALGGTYLWSPGGQTTQTITVSPLTTTTYSVTYTLNGVGTNNSTVTVFAPPAINAGLDIAICSGAQATLSGTGGVSYSWDNGVTNNLAFNPLNTATYTVTGTDLNGCTGTDQVTVTVNANPIVSGNTVICPNTTSQLSGSGTAAANNAWVSSATAVATVSNTGLVTALSFGTATITYTNNNGCSATATINVSNPTAPTFNPVAPVCNGGAILLPIISSNGIQGTWSPAINNTQTTTYTFTPSAGQCATTGQVSVTVNPNPTISGGTAVCSGGTIQLTGSGTAAATNAWASANTSVASISGSGLVSGTSAGTSVVTYTNNDGCAATATITVNANPIVSGNTVICPNTTSQLSGSGTAAANNAWVSSAAAVATVSNTGLVTALSFGTATITYTNNNGCSATTTINVSNPTAPTFNPVAAVCNGGAILLPIISSNGIQGTWSPALNNTQTTTYTFTPSAGQCATTGQVSVTVNPLPTVNAGIDQSICTGGTVTLSGSGGTTYTWDNSVSNGVAFTPLATATYTVSTTDANGCTNTDQVLVTVNPNPTVNGGNDQTVCVGGSATLSGSGASTYTWTGGVTNGVAFTPTVTSTYTVTGTSATGCVGTDQVTINVTAGPVAAIAGAAPICLGSQVTLTASPIGATYLWMPGGATTQTITVSPTSTTTYTLTVSLAGCGSSNATQSVVVNPAPTANYNDEACETYTWFGSTYTQSGTYTHLVPSPIGCDSVLYLNLTIHNNVVGNTEVVAACDSYQWNGQTYNQSGIYTYNGLTIHDCDSSATIDLTINSVPTASITAIGNTLSTTQVAGETYAWLDCATNTLIPNETAISYTPSTSGSYAVIATNSCGSDTSFCEDMIVGLTDLNLNQITIYPNPSNGIFQVYSKREITLLEIIDLNGAVVHSAKPNGNLANLDLRFQADGIYVLRVQSLENTSNFRIVKN
jgi:uncharacterized protein YjdB